ncbi:peptidylprolyl isomerase [Pseudaminobacter sp. 19-2017]|uniref:Parvulin-like PPIase n=1 Tax=Pseudaminobacter soli (ex Zhang et al. 2022) TaxID=2831468 RepID=A0A942I759_9HYPH|nr:peptidylprolyl isomerase [Pseudaminobacter soli]MBS3648050.1 peptidylprolyl isomerase [Pseudaminobacter soli]
MLIRYRRAVLASLGLAALVAFSANGARAQESAGAQQDKVVATVAGQPITEADLTQAISDLQAQFARVPEDQRRAAALSAIIEIKVLAAEGTAKGYDKSPDFERRMAFLRDRALHSEVIEKEIANRITDDEIRKRYDTEIANTPPTNEVHARHILVKTKEEAEAIIKQIEGGAKFEDIAKEKSGDAGSGAQGGDLGWFGPGQMVPEFEKAAFALGVGEFTKEPVQSQFGWHIIKVEDKRTKQPPAFDVVKEQIRSLMLREKYFELVKSLEAGKVDITDPDLKKAIDAEKANEADKAQ